MAKNGPIVFIEDDVDDQEIYSDAIQQLYPGQAVKFLSNGEEAFSYLTTTTDSPFIIFCDINMPFLNGIELRSKINSNEFLRSKSIPFIFFTTYGHNTMVKEAFLLNIQGFFIKPQKFDDIKLTIEAIVAYWKRCVHPNSL